MAKEQQSDPLKLMGIHIDLVDQVVTLRAHDGRTAKLSFGRPVDADAPFAGDTSDEMRDDEEAEDEEASPTGDSREKETTLVVSGKLKTQPQAGRPDGRGNPTAWARLAIHDEGSEQAHLYSATFHRHTAAIALGLSKEAAVTVEGYAHASADDEGARMDRFSVVNVLAYPGKPEKPARSGRRR